MNTTLSSSQKISLRLAKITDEALLMQWRNRPEIIALGSSQRPVNAVEHAEWFVRTLKSESRCLFIVLFNNLPIGQIRFEIGQCNHAEISVFLLNEYTGKGLGVKVIVDGCKLAFDAFPVAGCIIAFVRENNITSLRAFLKAGFERDPSGTQRSEHYCLRLFRS